MNHAPVAGSIAQPVDQQSSALPLNHGCPLYELLNMVKHIHQIQAITTQFVFTVNIVLFLLSQWCEDTKSIEHLFLIQQFYIYNSISAVYKFHTKHQNSAVNIFCCFDKVFEQLYTLPFHSSVALIYAQTPPIFPPSPETLHPPDIMGHSVGQT